MSRDHLDALIDQLLRESLGGDRPRDITQRVLAQARLLDRARRTWWLGAAAAVAASIAIAVGLVGLWPRAYPEARLVDGGMLMNTAKLDRGSQLETADDQSAKVNIGGYVDLFIGPETALTLGGAKFQEKVVLERGRVDVDVHKNTGKFDVAVGPATVHVTGTKFGVNVVDDVDEGQSLRQKKMLVEVEDGSVEVMGVDNPVTLTSGASETFILSSERISQIAPPKVSDAPTTRVVPGVGLAAGMREGNRIGTRGAPALRPIPDALIPINRGGNAARGPDSGVAPLVKPMQLVIGSLDLRGYLRHDHDVYYIEAPNRNLFLYSQQPPFPNWQPPVDAPVRVTWISGRISSITDLSVRRPDLIPPASRPAAPTATLPGMSSPSPAQIPL